MPGAVDHRWSRVHRDVDGHPITGLPHSNPVTAGDLLALTLRRRKDTKAQDPSAQVRVRRADRVRMVSMPTENEE